MLSWVAPQGETREWVHPAAPCECHPSPWPLGQCAVPNVELGLGPGVPTPPTCTGPWALSTVLGDPPASGSRRVPGSDLAPGSIPVVGDTALQPPPTSSLVVTVFVVFWGGSSTLPTSQSLGFRNNPKSHLRGNAWAILASN